MVFVLGCVGVVFIAAMLMLLTLAWLAVDNALFADYSWLEWLTVGSLEAEFTFRVYALIAGGLCFVGYWIGRGTGMW
jgi:hypothetical protein